ncbi:MAG: NifU family protein [Bacteroidetes bacterium]|jgi:Fe-S cluster biogenesis protein NfuA|nr:NifU family protein [Bacteroidota bacterium]MBT3747824.1 NifU family protein [Bacteroidota bacterium]MBT4399303.1 NifU family protein [Bacteroidota bacterium]MBT4411900.1 NifU family protein [Bacteroidota bacterium]MBT7091867.1 NifU family protein [Bacteroidota bacterium]
MVNVELHERIKTVLDQIRPYLQADGGDLNLVEITDDLVVKVELTGACGSCPMRTMTLKAGVEGTLKKEIPEVKSVESV